MTNQRFGRDDVPFPKVGYVSSLEGNASIGDGEEKVQQVTFMLYQFGY